MSKIQCAVVMPVYNEMGCIRDVLTDWDRAMALQFNESYALVVVNDGSTDATGKVLEELQRELPRLHVSTQPNGGHGAALLNAYGKGLALDPQYVFHVDSDNQFLASDFPRLWDNRGASSFILGRRVVRHDSFHRIVISKILAAVVTLVFGVSIEDVNVPFRLIRASYLRELLNQLPTAVFAPNIFLSVLAVKNGQSLMGIPVTHMARVTGKVSILRLKLLKVCFRSFWELVQFRSTLSQKVSALRKAQV
jgi:glycosyltransferase involved in cell wall biosynthesis